MPADRVMPQTTSNESENRQSGWLETLDCDYETRISRMQARYWDLASDSGETRADQMRAMILDELDTAEAQYREITEARLRAWLRLARVDERAVRDVARTWDAVFATLPGALEFRRAMAVQSVVARVIEDGDRERLVDLVPGIARFLPPTSLRVSHQQAS